MNYISEGSTAFLRCNIIYENCWRYHLANPHLPKRDCLSPIRQSPNAGLKCLVNDVYSNCRRIAFPPLGIWAQITPGHVHGRGRFIYRLLVSGNGERDRIRTCDPVIKSHLLYQLSYAPDLLRECGMWTGTPCTRQGYSDKPFDCLQLIPRFWLASFRSEAPASPATRICPEACRDFMGYLHL